MIPLPDGKHPGEQDFEGQGVEGNEKDGYQKHGRYLNSVLRFIAFLNFDKNSMVSGVRFQVSGFRRQRSENRNQMTYQYAQNKIPISKSEDADLSSVNCPLSSVFYSLTPDT